MRRRHYLALAGAGLFGALGGCGGPDRSDPGGGTGTDTSLGLAATTFDDGEPIPPRYTCDGGDVNPELTVSGVVDAAETLALVMDDPDAGNEPYVHWLLWNVPAGTETIPRSVDKREQPPFADGARQGVNSGGEIGYLGPCPPQSDDAHTYRFRLSAVDTTLDLEAGADRAALDDALSGNLVDTVTLRGTYARE